MKPPPLIALIALTALLTLLHGPASAAIRCGEPCHGLLLEAQGLEGRGKYQEALDTYKAAQTAEPTASLPFSLAAGLLLKLSSAAPKDRTAEVRTMARGLAEHAATLDGDDPIAQEVMRMLDDDGPSPLHQPGPEASRLLAEGGALFGQGRFEESLVKYEAAMRADPRLSGAWVGAGDYYFVMGDWPRAESLFRQATEIEPRNAQAWRFLSDALLAQRKHGAAEAALYSSLAADPSQRPTWSKLARLRAGAGLPLKALAFRRGVRVDRDAPAAGKSPFEIELAAWRTALEAIDGTGAAATDPALLQMQALAKDGQLEPAILLLTFRQAYRPALEAWLAANPGGVKAFIDRYGLRP